MWTTELEVKELTGFDIPLETIVKAQTIIEAYVGRIEGEVTNATDVMLLGRATVFQAVYMVDNDFAVYQTPASLQYMQFGSMITYKQNDGVSPYVAPLAVIACQRLSWKRIRSIKTGSIYNTPVQPYDWGKD